MATSVCAPLEAGSTLADLSHDCLASLVHLLDARSVCMLRVSGIKAVDEFWGALCNRVRAVHVLTFQALVRDKGRC
jgi:hypothetical protein